MAGLGGLKAREDIKILGTDKEKTLYEPQDYFWGRLGQECALNGISVDSYICANGYIDLASICIDVFYA
jgi:protein transport protein SEC24